MKRTAFLTVLVSMIFGAVSCQREIIPDGVTGDVTVSLSVSVPEAATKAIADGTNVDILYYEIWSDNGGELGKKLVGSTKERTEAKLFDLDLTLVSDQTYHFLFWAQVNGNDYYDVSDLTAVKVNYTYKDANGVDKPYPANDESRAAFFAKETFTVTESFSETVVLKRPFAQLNFGTTTLQSDLSGNVKVNTSKVTVSKAATVFNVAAGVGSVPTSASVVFDAAAIPADPTMLKVNNVDYHYLSMNYFLVDGESDNISVSAEFATEFGTVAHSIVEVPVAENYRTNILGDLLFSKADLKIIVDEDFVADYNGDSEGNFAPAYNEEDKTYFITSADELRWVSEQTAAGNTFSGQILTVMNDIDLGGTDWAPISGFSGTFTGASLVKADASYPTIKNFKVDVVKAGGLFGSVTNGKIENINISGADIRSNHYAGVLVGYMHGAGYVKNVHVSDSKVTVTPVLNDEGKYDDGDKAGAIAGYFCEDGRGTMRMEGCSATKVDILAYRDLGGLVGCLNGDSAYIGSSTVTDVTVTADTDYDYKDDSATNAGQVVGRLEGGATVGDDNQVNNVTVTLLKLAELVSVEGAVVELLPEKTYKLPAVIADNVTLVGAEGTVLTCPEVVKAKNITVKNADFVQVVNEKKYAALRLKGYGTFEDCSFTGMNGLYQGYSDEGSLDGPCTFTRCRFEATWAYAFNTAGVGPVIIDDCELIGWTSFGHKGTVTIKDTDFDWNGTYGQLRLYDESYIENCSFTENVGIDFYHHYNTTLLNGKNITFKNNTVVGGGSFVELIDMSCFDDAQPVLLVDGVRYVSGSEAISLDNNTVAVAGRELTKGMEVSGRGTLILENVKITAAEGNAITLAEGSDVVLIGKNLVAEATAGSGISGKNIHIKDFDGLTAKGEGKHAYGIGADNAEVIIENSNVDYAKGGLVQQYLSNDDKYGKNAPEGAPAIGGAVIMINGSVVTKADGGSKAAAIGAKYWQSTDIKIQNSTIVEANGGTSSAGIGGSRYSQDISASNKQVSKIYIENSTVTATGGDYGSGIGSGYDTHCSANNTNAVNDIQIVKSTINATGGKYAAGIGTGYHAAALTGSIDAESKITAISGEKFYKDAYYTAQDIGYGVIDPAREGKDLNVTFTVAGSVIATPTKGTNE